MPPHVSLSKQQPRYNFTVNTLRPRRNRRHFAGEIFKCILLNENVLIAITISLKYITKGPIDNIPTSNRSIEKGWCHIGRCCHQVKQKVKFWNWHKSFFLSSGRKQILVWQILVSSGTRGHLSGTLRFRFQFAWSPQVYNQPPSNIALSIHVQERLTPGTSFMDNIAGKNWIS